MSTILTLSGSDVLMVFAMGSLSGLALAGALHHVCRWLDQRDRDARRERWRERSVFLGGPEQ
jgi:hypothetical protein